MRAAASISGGGSNAQAVAAIHRPLPSVVPSLHRPCDSLQRTSATSSGKSSTRSTPAKRPSPTPDQDETSHGPCWAQQCASRSSTRAVTRQSQQCEDPPSSDHPLDPSLHVMRHGREGRRREERRTGGRRAGGERKVYLTLGTRSINHQFQKAFTGLSREVRLGRLHPRVDESF